MDSIEVRVLGPGDGHVLADVAPGVFDRPIDQTWTSEFLNDSRHHLAVALDAGRVIGMASAVHYVHPDKPAELWINEVGVTPSHQRLRVGRRLLAALLALGEELGCHDAWVLTDRENEAAVRMYAAAGGVEEPPAPIMFTFRCAVGAAPSAVRADRE
jgi:GNAT superfamily N-acetyltransferase